LDFSWCHQCHLRLRNLPHFPTGPRASLQPNFPEDPRVGSSLLLALHPRSRPLHLVRHSANSQEPEPHLGPAVATGAKLTAGEGMWSDSEEKSVERANQLTVQMLWIPQLCNASFRRRFRLQRYQDRIRQHGLRRTFVLLCQRLPGPHLHGSLRDCRNGCAVASLYRHGPERSIGAGKISSH
jgi:hypothetical protein